MTTHPAPVSLSSLEIGGGRVLQPAPGRWRLVLPPHLTHYADAQLDDGRGLPRGRFPWRPPLRLRLRARASHAAPLGTLGFGFWNDPFAVSLGQGGAARRFPASPQAVWFFYGSPPNDFAFTPGLPGHGWKAMALRGPRLPSLLLAPLAAGAFLLTRVPGVRRPAMRRALGSVRAAEALVETPLDAWHTYELTWRPGEVRFLVDGREILAASLDVPGLLTFVAWIDNQYAVATPEKGFGFGVVPTVEEQWLEIEALEVLRE